MSKTNQKLQVLRFGSTRAERSRVDDMIQSAVGSFEAEYIDTTSDIDLKHKKLMVAIESDEIGGHPELYRWLRQQYAKQNETGELALKGSTAILLVNSEGPLYTKRLAQYAIFHMNRMGCRFIGHPLVEAVDQLQNFKTWQKVVDLPLKSILLQNCEKLGRRLMEFELPRTERPKLLIMHSSSKKTSNTLMLWEMVGKHLEGFEVQEYHIEEDKIAECKGCNFKTCMHYSEIRSCYYGGIMVEKILPAMEWADGVIWVCPNYNDAISAKLMAVINRMTVLYRRITFYDKRLFGIIVSGNSGSDLVITQLLGALNINKGFMLPPEFGFSAIANDPGAIHDVEDIEERAKTFAMKIQEEFSLSAD